MKQGTLFESPTPEPSRTWLDFQDRRAEIAADRERRVEERARAEERFAIIVARLQDYKSGPGPQKTSRAAVIRQLFGRR